MKYLLIIWLLSSPFIQSFTPTTDSVAQEIRYPQHITNLRNQTEQFLAQYRVAATLDVNKFKERSLDYRADELEEVDRGHYFDYENKFDQAFKHIDEKYLALSQELNYTGASRKTKARELQKLLNYATNLINRKMNYAPQVINRKTAP